MRRIFEDNAYQRDVDTLNYWRATTPNERTCPALDGRATTEFAIIGAGFTGLNAALHLAREGADVTVLDAHGPGWGASGRNGGFCCLGGAKASDAVLKRRFGEAGYRKYRQTEKAAVDFVDDLLVRLQLDVDRHSSGETVLAHRPKDMDRLRREAEEIHDEYGVDVELIEKADLAAQGMNSAEFHGGLTVRKGFGLNPRKYVQGLAHKAVTKGVRIHGDSPVTGITRIDDGYELRSPSGTLQAKHLLLATNGYSSDDLPEWMRARYLPIQSNIIVTRPLTDDEIAEQGWFSDQMAYDTRHLLHYFRLMPNRRMLFGMRGGVNATPQAHERMRTYVRSEFDRIFPAWTGVETPYFWTGLACLSRNLTPYVGPIGDWPDAFASFAYHGNGVAMGSYCGMLMAELALGRKSHHICPDVIKAPPARFPFGRFRRALLPITFLHYNFLDRP
ncbi:NAD(P)/FAD-dependent oxidoreductase [Qingshengfaniella alkalisoli]|uniref:FAD-binding oxidoreductase n=1 Tax=Qingshengfaniella alkalisoli TaxID=2599296 RepID=A0A5B8ID46_9RHOB|nr:FAD-binding oxidoreductase [Qingshengfaniella alkalisoli]QDY71566.1 FAD-binding oxidoreductase [Qingshengfaniella alkalisoli]